jgi:hypothetical protein
MLDNCVSVPVPVPVYNTNGVRIEAQGSRMETAQEFQEISLQIGIQSNKRLSLRLRETYWRTGRYV